MTLLLVSTSAAVAYEDEPRVTWTMVDVTRAGVQGDAHLIEADGHILLIDAGTRELAVSELVPYLRDQAIDSIDTVFVSHMHEDHYGGVQALLDAGIEISDLQISIPDDEVCGREVPWGCDARKNREILARFEAEGIDVREPEAGEEWSLGDGASLELIARLDADSPDVPAIDVNDTSMIMRLDVGDTSVLFTGDLNKALGRALSKRDLGLGPNVLLKVPHHGAESVAENEFFAHVDPDSAFVPAPMSLWCSERSARVRTWLAEHGVRTFVSGSHGDVTVVIDEDGDTVGTERPPVNC